MDIDKKYIWTLILLPPIIAYVAVSFIATSHERGFNPSAAFYYYSIAFTCSNSALLCGELALILGSLALFRAAILSSPNGLYTFLATIFWSIGVAAPVVMAFTGIIPYCWPR